MLITMRLDTFIGVVMGVAAVTGITVWMANESNHMLKDFEKERESRRPDTNKKRRYV